MSRHLTLSLALLSLSASSAFAHHPDTPNNGFLSDYYTHHWHRHLRHRCRFRLTTRLQKALLPLTLPMMTVEWVPDSPLPS